MSYPDNNPKTAIGVTKAPLHLVPPSATYYLALAFKDGAAKYGPYNWRDKTVSSSVYIGAAKRHMDAWWDGEDLSADAKVEHIAHAMACLAIILDAQSVGKLNDDRPTKGAAARLQAEFGAPVQLELFKKEPNERTKPKTGYSGFQLDEFRRKETTSETIGSKVSEGYSGFLTPDPDPVVERGVPDIQEDVCEADKPDLAIEYERRRHDWHARFGFVAEDD